VQRTAGLQEVQRQLLPAADLQSRNLSDSSLSSRSGHSTDRNDRQQLAYFVEKLW
jgi:hypothetical protein